MKNCIRFVFRHGFIRTQNILTTTRRMYQGRPCGSDEPLGSCGEAQLCTAAPLADPVLTVTSMAVRSRACIVRTCGEDLVGWLRVNLKPTQKMLFQMNEGWPSREKGEWHGAALGNSCSCTTLARPQSSACMNRERTKHQLHRRQVDPDNRACHLALQRIHCSTWDISSSLSCSFATQTTKTVSTYSTTKRSPVHKLHTYPKAACT